MKNWYSCWLFMVLAIPVDYSWKHAYFVSCQKYRGTFWLQKQKMKFLFRIGCYVTQMSWATISIPVYSCSVLPWNKMKTVNYRVIWYHWTSHVTYITEITKIKIYNCLLFNFKLSFLTFWDGYGKVGVGLGGCGLRRWGEGLRRTYLVMS